MVSTRSLSKITVALLLVFCAHDCSVADKDCFLKRFWERTRQLTPTEIAEALHEVKGDAPPSLINT